MMGRDAAMRREFEGEPTSERRMGDDDALRRITDEFRQVLLSIDASLELPF